MRLPSPPSPRTLARRYGASPLHLLAHLAVLPLAAWAILQIVDIRGARDVLVWFVAALILQDLVLLPAYSLLDRGAQRLRVGGMAIVNHLRVPALITGLTFLVFFPLILGKSDGSLRYVSGIQPTGYLERWLAIVAVVWGLSAALLAVRLARSHQLQRPRRATRHGHRARR